MRVVEATKALDVSLDEFFELKPEEEKTGPSHKALKLAERISTLPRAKQSIVVSMIEGTIQQA